MKLSFHNLNMESKSILKPIVGWYLLLLVGSCCITDGESVNSINSLVEHTGYRNGENFFIRNKRAAPKASTLLKLCPKKPSNFRYDKETKICSEIGTQGHCGQNMVFYSLQNDAVYGLCDCDQSKPTIYRQQTNQCYFLYQQGYCKEGEWIEISGRTKTPVCAPNKCYDSGRPGFGQRPLASRDKEPEYAPLNGSGPCVKLNEPSDQCRYGQLVTIKWPSRPFAECNNLDLSLKHLSVNPALQCAPGSSPTAFGRCQIDFDFD